MSRWETYFFEIAVYRCPRDQHFEEVAREAERLTWEAFGRFGLSKEEGREHYERMENHVWEKNGGPWEYNQAVGWLRLFVLGSQIRADYFFTNAKRLQRKQRAKNFRYELKAFELTMYPEFSNSQIHRAVREELDSLRKERPFKGRFIDLESFDNLAPYIDWRSLLGFDRNPTGDE